MEMKSTLTLTSTTTTSTSTKSSIPLIDTTIFETNKAEKDEHTKILTSTNFPTTSPSPEDKEDDPCATLESTPPANIHDRYARTLHDLCETLKKLDNPTSKPHTVTNF